MTLIFYKIGAAFWKEPFLNLVAAAFQMSSFTHVEMAIGAPKFPARLQHLQYSRLLLPSHRRRGRHPWADVKCVQSVQR